MGASGATGCDQGKQRDQPTVGVYVEVVDVNVGTDKPALAANDAIQIAFTRELLPSSVTRQSLTVRDAFGVPLNPTVSYDPVARVVTIGNPNPQASTPWLLPGQPYTLELVIPDDQDPFGVRAIDGATLNPAKTPRFYGFNAGPVTPTPLAEPTMSFCDDVWPVFWGHCSESGICHSAPKPAAALVLDSADGLARTAIGHVAHGANTGPAAASGPAGAAPGNLFGVDMPVIDPGNPGNSWLMYKLLLPRYSGDEPLPDPLPDPRPRPPGDDGDHGSGRAGGDAAPPSRAAPPRGGEGTEPVSVAPLFAPPPPPPCVPLAGPSPFTTAHLPWPFDAAERQRLANYVIGRPMPYPFQDVSKGRDRSYSSDGQGLTFDELERIRTWIAQGAHVKDCTCRP